MRINGKNLLVLSVLAITFALTSCQSELVEPSPKKPQTAPAEVHYDLDDVKPPKTGWPN